jgi:hypothetical protein
LHTTFCSSRHPRYAEKYDDRPEGNAYQKKKVFIETVNTLAEKMAKK